MTTTQQPQAGPARPGLGTVRGRVALVTGGTRGIGAGSTPSPTRRWTGSGARSPWAGSAGRRRSRGSSASSRPTSPRTSTGRSGPSTAAWTCDVRQVSGGVMEDHRDVLVLSATRTAIGRYGGGLAPVPPCDLAAPVVREAVSRAGREPAHVGPAGFRNRIPP